MSQGVITDSNDEITKILHADLDEQTTPLTTKRANSLLSSIISDRDCAHFLKSTNLWSADTSWKGVPKKATSHRSLSSHLHVIMLDILQYFNYVEKSHTISETTTRTPSRRLTRSMCNDISALPAGAAAKPDRGLQIFPRRRQPLDQLKRQPDGLITGTSLHFKPNSKDDSWYRAVAAFDVRTERERESNGDSEDHRWLFNMAYYALETLSTQKTRHFVYGFIISESHVQVYRFDRCGVVQWPWLNYHDDPTILIRTLLLVCNHDLKKIGVDSTVTFNTKNQREFSMTCQGKHIHLTQIDTLFSSTELCERATMCWVVEDDRKQTYLLKQQFADVKRRTEGEHLKGVDIPAIAKIHYEQRYEKMSKSRGVRKPYPDSFYDRVMVRGVFDLYGGPIDLVESRRGLLLALHDVISGHRDLWLKHNLLHRDISFGNILYRKIGTLSKEKPMRPHGVLIDFDLSSRYDPAAPREKYEVFNQTGTTCFQSLNTVSADWFDTSPDARWKPLHDHIEELETFFWVLYWITSLDAPPEEINRLENNDSAMSAPLNSSAVPSIDLHQEFNNADCESSARHKLNVLRNKRASMAVPKRGWGKAYEELVMTFATFCDTQSLRKKREACVGGLEEPVTMEQSRERAPMDYETVLGFFKKAIRDLDLEFKSAVAPRNTARPLRDVHQQPTAPQRPVAAVHNSRVSKRARDSDTEMEGHIPTDPITEPEDSPNSKKGKR